MYDRMWNDLRDRVICTEKEYEYKGRELGKCKDDRCENEEPKVLGSNWLSG